MRTVCEPIFDRPLKDISFGTVLLRLFEISRRFNGQIQPQLMLLQKTLLNVEGLGRQLYPELDIWHTASPILREWMRERMSPRNVLRELRRGWPDALEIIKALPPLARRAVEQLGGEVRRLQGCGARRTPAPAALPTGTRSDRVIVGGVLFITAALWLGMRLRAALDRRRAGCLGRARCGSGPGRCASTEAHATLRVQGSGRQRRFTPNAVTAAEESEMTQDVPPGGGGGANRRLLP